MPPASRTSPWSSLIPPAQRVIHRAGRLSRALVRGRGAGSLDAQIGESRHGRCIIRSLRRSDGQAWATAMRANHHRMQPWWDLEGDVESETSRASFLSHYVEWERRLRGGHGACLAVVGPEGLIGELQLWNVHPGGLTGELGLWLSPESSLGGRDLVGALRGVLGRLFGEVGLRRIEAPVAVGNDMPRKLLSITGFEVDASIPEWRELGGRLVDYDLYALTPERWAAAQPRLDALLRRG